MKKIVLSLTASALLASGVYAIDTDSGTISGEVSAYTTSNSETDSGYTNGSVSVDFESKENNGLKVALGAIANVEISEENDGDYANGSEEDVLLRTANISYSTDGVTVIAGRQEISLEWIGDYHEALVAAISTVPNTTIVAGYTQAMTGDAGNDGALMDFADIGNDGAMVVDATYKASDALTLGAYYMSANDIFSAYGVSVDTSAAGLGIVAKYATTSEDTAGTNDGNIMALDLSKSVDSLDFGVGYIQTDKDGGAGSITKLGDSINPFDNGDTYGADTTAMYASVGTTVGGVELGLLAGSIDTAGAKDTEIDLSASWECKLVKNLSMSALYVNYSADNSANDSAYYSLQAAYSF